MSRKMWIALIAFVVMTLVGGAVGVGGFLYYPVYKANKYLREGNAAFAKGQWRKAKSYYAWYIHQYPEEIEPLERYAEASLKIMAPRNVALRDAGKAYLQLVRKHPDNTAFAERALQFYRDKELWDLLDAAAEYMLITKPDDPLLLYYKALAQDRKGRLLTSAIASYEAIPDWSKVPATIHGDYASLQIKLGESTPDLTRIKAALEAEPNRPDLLCQYARILADTGELEEAQAALQKAENAGTLDYESLLAATEVCWKGKDWEDVETYARKAVALNADDYRAYLQLTGALEQQGKPSEILALLRELPKEMLADHPKLYLPLCETALAERELDTAEAFLERYRAEWPNHEASLSYLDARILLFKAATMDEKQAQDAAKKAAEKLLMVVKTNPTTFPRAQFYLVLAYLQVDKEDKEGYARNVLDTFIRNYPKYQQARDLRDIYFRTAETPEDALKNAQRILNDNLPHQSVEFFQKADSLLRAFGDKLPPADQIPVLEELLSRALAGDPTMAGTHALSIDLKLRQNDLAGAREQLDRAKNAGANENKLARSEVALLLAEGNRAEALKRFAASLNKKTSKEQVEGWARFFTVRAGLEAGLDAIDTAVETLPDGVLDEGALDTVKVQVHLWANDIDGARAQLAALDAKRGDDARHWAATRSVRLALIQRLFQDGKPDALAEARRLLAECRKREPDDAQARLIEARDMLRSTPPDLDGAEALAKEVLQANPKHVGANLLLSNIVSMKGYSRLAAKYAGKAAEAIDATQPPNMRTACANAFLRAGDYDGARAQLDTVLAGNPDHPQALELSVRTSLARGQAQRAREDLARLEALPENVVSKDVLQELQDLLTLHADNGNQAIEELRKRFEDNPESFRVARSYSSALERQGDLREAERVLENHAEARKNSVESWVMLGQFRLRQGTEESYLTASSAFTRALLLMPDYAPALEGLIRIHLRTGNAGAALGLCNRYLQVQPDNANILYQKALILSGSESNYESALSTIDKAIAVELRPEFLRLRGMLRLDMNADSEALEDFQQLRTLQGMTDALIDACMAHAYAKLGDLETARQYYDLAREGADETNAGLSARLEKVEALLQEGQ